MTEKPKETPPSLKEFSALTSYFFVLTHPKTWKALFPYLWTVLKDFFFLQYREKLGLLKIKIIHVDCPYDELVPFKPEKVDIYLDFINFWIRPLSCLIKHNKKTASRHFIEFLSLINRCYKEAADFYRFRMSTTNRPKGIANRKFFWLKLLDPHYLCVPSLHVSVMALATTYYKRAFKEEQFSKEEQDFYNAEIYKGAIEIAETVLYTKQHSINCIGAALYMMNYILDNEFSIQDAVDFIDSMFKNADDISDENKKIINDHLNTLFEQLLLEGSNEYDWITPLKRWIIKYENNEQN